MPSPTVFIIDDDAGFCDSLALLLETAGLRAECYASAEKFLEGCDPDSQGCLMLDVRLPGMSGPELQEELGRRNVKLPIIFLTAYAEVRIGIDAMKRGAVEFVSKPFNGVALLEIVRDALERDRARHQAEEVRRLLRERLLKLTVRECEVLELALSGLSNKEISTRLRVSLRTVEGHRSHLLLKFGIRTLLELSQQAAAAGVTLDKAVADAKTDPDRS